MQTITPTPTPFGVNSAIIDLHRLGKIAFITLLMIILTALLLKIILDLRKFHYKD